MKRFLVAIQFLTRLPTPRVESDAEDFAASIRWFPAVGLLIGAIVAGAEWLGAHIDPWVGAMAALAAWVMVTGALHLDGLSDLADGCGAAHGNRDRLLAVMADPHVGSFGVVAIGVQLLAKLVLLHALGGNWPALTLIPFAARIGPLVWARWLPPLHAGLGAKFAGAVGMPHLIAWGALLLAVAWVAPGLLAALMLVPLWALWLRRKIGGISGDGHGAGIELIETGLLLACLL
ncbi:adenosylcobinamide-GDP ribazoletransferase [Sphingomonas sp. PR090111-T3T-6A]|uniref:adenosylcobinamide-GDP ribazoletransferase n=1 Tax=Sphingomonas sp. PR090111-T3T-6A TaxID=685778 RepID=UPI00035C0BE0|nr:adenosylcobinamide-GDP ribazoletransferase [Sphingomonas sp. PR090111-T3T-6A]